VQCANPWRRRPMAGQCVQTKPNQCDNPLPTSTTVVNDVVVVAQPSNVTGGKPPQIVTHRVCVNKSLAEGVVVFKPIPWYREVSCVLCSFRTAGKLGRRTQYHLHEPQRHGRHHVGAQELRRSRINRIRAVDGPSPCRVRKATFLILYCTHAAVIPCNYSQS
jgi:hypothetical protein